MTGGNEPAIAAAGLTKRYGKTAALRGVGLQASAGTVTALLGPNGAGKTTMVRILSTLLRPDAGTAWVGGYDVAREPERVRARIGLTGQSLSSRLARCRPVCVSSPPTSPSPRPSTPSGHCS